MTVPDRTHPGSPAESAPARRRNPGPAFAGAVVAIVAVLVLAARAFRGIDFTDESFHAALTYRFLLGDVPFRDELTVHQTAALLTLPALWLYDRVADCPDGVILFLRLLFVAFSAALGLVIWRALRGFLGDFGAALAAAIYVLVYPAQDFSYNTLGSGLSAAALFLALFGGSRSAPWRLGASGAAAGLAAIAYPPLVLWLALLAAGLVLLPRGEQGRSPLRPFAAGAGLVLLPFAALLVAIGPGHALEAVRMTNETANKLGNFRKVLVLGYYFLLRVPIISVLLVLGADRLARARPRFAALRAPVCLVAVLAACAGFLDRQGQLRPIAEWPNGLVSLCLLAPFLIAMLRDGRESRRLLFALWAGGAAAGIVTAYFTSNEPGNFAKSGRPCLVALVAAVWLLARGEARSRRRIVRAAAGALAGIVLLFTVVALEGSGRYVYRDRPLPELTRRVLDGPFAGIRTSPRRYELVTGLQRDLEASVPAAAHVVFFDDFPAGFLMSRRSPGVCGVWVFTRGEDRAFRRIYVDCTRRMARTPLYAIRLAVDSRRPEIPLVAPDPRDPFQRFIAACGERTAGREGLYDIFRVDPLCPGAGSAAAPARIGVSGSVGAAESPGSSRAVPRSRSVEPVS